MGRMGRRKPWRRLARSIRNINKRLTSEVKKHDTNVVDATIDVAGTVTALTSIAQGDTVATRTGNQVQGKYLTFRGSITTGTAITDLSPVRMIIVQDTQMTPGTAPTVAQILEATAVNSLYNRANVGRFNIIYDRMFGCFPGVDSLAAAVNEPAQAHWFSKTIRISGLPRTRWTGATNTDFQSGHFFLVLLAAVDEGGQIDANFRFGFWDN